MTARYMRLAQYVGDERDLLTLPVDEHTAISIGDFVFWDGDKILPLYQAPLVGTPAQNQTWAAAHFVGIAVRSHAAGTPATSIPVATRGVFELDCELADFAFGAWLGPASVGAEGAEGLSCEQVEEVPFPAQAIARCLREAAAAPRVVGEIFSSFRLPPHRE